MPAAPTDLAILAESAGSPVATLSWDHSGVDLDRFEVLRLASGSEAWEPVKLAAAGEFGAGPYELLVASTPGTEWAVRALNDDGEVSS